MVIHLKEPPEAGVLFPSLRRAKAEPVDDDGVFRQVAAQLAPFGR